MTQLKTSSQDPGAPSRQGNNDDPEWTKTTPEELVYIFRVGKREKKIPALKNVQSLRLKQTFNLAYEPTEIVDSRGVSFFAVGTGLASVFLADDLQVGQVYDISGFNLRGHERRVEIALLLCNAAYKEDPVGYLGSPNVKTRHPLGDICVANKGDETDPSYLVAFSDDNLSPKTKEVFIAICGTPKNYEITQRMKLLPVLPGIEGGAHEGLLTTTEKIPMDLLAGLIEQRQPQRITICGHSVGGAIAHLYLLLYLIERGKDVLPADTDIVSIAFGSPLCADNTIWRWLSSMTNYQERFWSFNNDLDIVPRALNLIANIYGSDANIPRVFGRAKRCADLIKIAFPKANLVGSGLKLLQDSLKTLLEDPWVVDKLQEIYVPFGWWIICTRSQNGHYETEYELDNASISERPDPSELTKKAFHDHGLDEYSTALWSVLGFANIPDVERLLVSPVQSPTYESFDEMEIKEIDVRRSSLYEPKIDSLKVQYMEKKYRRGLFRLTMPEKNDIEFTVEVNGSNLQFLASSTKSCSSIQVERFYVDGSSLDMKLSSSAGNKYGKGSTFLIAKGSVEHIRHGGISKSSLCVKTHFGISRVSIRHAELKQGVNSPFAGQFANEAVYQLLHKAIRRCYISRRKGNEESLGLLNALDQLERKVLNSDKSHIREAIEDCCSYSEKSSGPIDIEDGLPDLDQKTLPWCWRILMGISSNLPITKKNGLTFYLVAATMTVAGFAVGGAGTLLVAARLAIHGATLASAGVGAGVGAAVAAFSSFGVGWAVNKKMLLEKEHAYRLVLETLLQQLKPDDGSTPTETLPLDTPYLSEDALTSKWKALGYSDLDIDAIAKNGPFRDDKDGAYYNASFNSVKSAVQRIQSIILLHEIRLMVLSSSFVTAIGPQNAGKTTALTKIFPGLWDLPNHETITIGIGKHTRQVTTYEFDNLTIVDFPGFNTINQSDSSGPDRTISKKIRNSMALSCALASVIVCVFPFSGSPTKDLSRLLDTVKDHIGEVPILICMNKASKTMDDEDGLISKNAVNEWRARLMAQLGIEDNVQEDIRLEFTEFKDYSKEMEEYGILNADMVRDIVVSAIKEQMMMVDSSKVERMLSSAISRKVTE